MATRRPGGRVPFCRQVVAASCRVRGVHVPRGGGRAPTALGAPDTRVPVGQPFEVLAGVQCTRKSTVFTHYMKNLGVCTFTRIVCFGSCTVVKLPVRHVRMFIVWPEQWVCRPL